MYTGSFFFKYIFQLYFKRHVFKHIVLKIISLCVMIPFEGYRTFSINYVNHVQQIMYVWLNRSRDTSPNFHILQWNLYGYNVLKCKLTLFFRIGSLILTNTLACMCVFWREMNTVLKVLWPHFNNIRIVCWKISQ